jgi:hypothetical protein
MKKMNEEFTPKFLFVDHNKFVGLQVEYKKSLPKVTALKVAAEDLIDRSLTEPEMKQLFTDTKTFVEDIKQMIRSKFFIPQATTDFNLQSMGKSFEPIDEAATGIIENDFHYGIEGNEYILLDSEYERFENISKAYTTTAKQNLIIDTLERIIEDLAMVKSLGVDVDNGLIYRGFRGSLNLIDDTLQVDLKQIETL